MAKYKMRATMFGSLSEGGSIQCADAVDYPGISVTSVKENRNAEWKRSIVYGQEEFDTMEEAVAQWEADRAHNQG